MSEQAPHERTDSRVLYTRSLNVPGGVGGDSGRRRWLPHLLGGALVVALLSVTSILWFEYQERFPLVAPGSYIGTVRGVLGATEARPLRMYVERLADSDDMLFALLKEGWAPQSTILLLRDRSSKEEEAVLPIVLNGPEHALRFIGRGISAQSYAGVVEETKTHEQGTWHLTSIAAGTVATDTQQLRLALSLRAELMALDDKVEVLMKQIPNAKNDVETLTTFITEGDTLRARADDKFKVVEQQLQTAEEALRLSQEKARVLESKIGLAQKVTPMGRLVSLSREAYDRESRWLETVLRTMAKDPHESSAASTDARSNPQRDELLAAIKLAKERNAQFERLQPDAAQLPGNEASDVQD